MINVINACKKFKYRKKETVSLVKLVLRREKNVEGIINVIFADDKYIIHLNKSYLKHNYTTDVISFPLNEGDKIEGEIYINLEQARRQAKEYSATYKEEVNRLIIHGTLHLLGYSDQLVSEKIKMNKLEEKYLKILK